MNTESLPCNDNRCGHCKKLAPEYEKLGGSFKKAKSVLIGKVSSSPWFYIDYINIRWIIYIITDIFIYLFIFNGFLLLIFNMEILNHIV